MLCRLERLLASLEAATAQNIAGTSPAASVWFCGPQGFAEAVRQGMEQLGRSPARFHQELFQMR